MFSIVVTSLTSRERDRASGIENFVNDVIVPIQSTASRVSGTVQSVGSWFSSIQQVKSENERLAARIGELETVRAQLEEALNENRRLRDLVGFAQRSSFSFVPAEVIGRNADNWFSTITVNRGSRDSVEKDWPVVGSKGLLGRVMKVTPRTATVMLLLDPDASAGAMVVRSRDMGLILGGRTDGLLKMTMFSRDADVREGDVVVSSGLGSVFPKGILIGHVDTVDREEYGLIKSALVRPAADFSRIEEVLVLQPPREERPR
ncbi:MAG: rod shape-determining protein MreC [Firmicutes bacterium]|nr:rod shape-determining protein MreC [Bacillota bacterium]